MCGCGVVAAVTLILLVCCTVYVKFAIIIWNNAMKSESRKEVQLFCFEVHEIVRPKSNYLMSSGRSWKGKMFFMSTGSGKPICYALLPWVFNFLHNQVDWGTRFCAQRNKTVELLPRLTFCRIINYAIMLT